MKNPWNLSLLMLVGAVSSQAGPLKVVATTPDLADIARRVGGDRVVVECLSRGFQDPHFVEAKPSLILKLRDADLFIQNGLELEIGWAPLLVQGSRNSRIQPGSGGFLEASEFITPLEVPAVVSRAGGDVHPGGNPHFLADPENGRKVAMGLAGKMGERDPAHAEEYRRNAKTFDAELTAKIAEWAKLMAPYSGTLLVSYHRNVIYFTERFGLVPVGEIEPKPGIPPSPGHTAELIELMKAKHVPIILTMPYFEDRTPEFLSRSTGARVVVLALVPEALPAATDYMAAIDWNVRAVVAALKK